MMARMATTEFGRRMARARKAREWTRAHLAKSCGAGVMSIHDLETGAIREPRQSRAEAIAKALGVPVAWLWGAGPSTVPELAEPILTRAKRKRKPKVEAAETTEAA